MPRILVTGANRGIGLEFVRQYAAEGWSVLAACRDPQGADELCAVPGDVRIEALDVTDWPALERFAGRIDKPIDLFVSNAGVGRADPLEPEAWLHVLAVNAVAPTLLARALADRIADGGKAVAITSKMGSIADNESGGAIAYRSSKAALNAAWKSLAVDWRGRIVVAVLHPGWVKTRMGGPNALIEPEESVAGMRRVIAGLGPEESGGFYNHDGAEIPW